MTQKIQQPQSCNLEATCDCSPDGRCTIKGQVCGISFTLNLESCPCCDKDDESCCDASGCC